MLDNAATHRSLGTWTQERTIANISVVPVRGPDALYTQQSRSMPPNEVARDTIPRVSVYEETNLKEIKFIVGFRNPLVRTNRNDENHDFRLRFCGLRDARRTRALLWTAEPWEPALQRQQRPHSYSWREIYRVSIKDW